MTAIGFGARLAAGQDRGGWPGRGFDFSGGTMPPGATFARGSTATRITAAGAIATEPADAPRFDHDPAIAAGAGGGAGIVHADARVRLVVERPGPPPWPCLGAWRYRGEE